MPLISGAKLGSYDILSPLGAGGMGEVYRARDTKLNREVALKVLPEAFAANAERMARFEREAQVLASLNHTNIAAIYGLEESGPTRALVMEFVEGPTLAERIGEARIVIEETLSGNTVGPVYDRRPEEGDLAARRAALQPLWRRALSWALAAVGLAAALVATVLLQQTPRTSSPTTLRRMESGFLSTATSNRITCTR